MVGSNLHYLQIFCLISWLKIRVACAGVIGTWTARFRCSKICEVVVEERIELRDNMIEDVLTNMMESKFYVFCQLC